MIIGRLRITGFLSYREKVEIDLGGFSLACISGANGAGKSSLLEAITWALFGEARRKDDAIIHQHANTAEVCLDFIYEGQSYQVLRSKTRDKSTVLEFKVQSEDGQWRALTEATLRGTEERIRNTLHLDYETFINASFFLQGKADQFAQQRPGDRKRILSGILGLDIWELYREETARRRKVLEIELKLVESRLEEIEAELAQEGERKARLAELEKEVAGKQALFNARKELLDQQRLVNERILADRRQVEKQREEVQRLQSDLSLSQSDLQERRQEQLDYQQQLAREDEINKEVATWKASVAALAEWDALAANFHQYEVQRQQPLQEIAEERARLQTELDLLQQTRVLMAAQESALPGLKDEVQKLDAAIGVSTKKLASRAVLEIEKTSLMDEKAHARAENVRLKSEMDEIVAHRTSLSELAEPTCPTCEKPLSAKERQKLIDELNVRGKERGDTWRENVKKAEQCDARYRQVESELADLQRLEAELKGQQRLFDSKNDELQRKLAEVAAWHGTQQVRLDELTAILTNASFAAEARRKLADIEAHLKELGYDAAEHDKIRQAEQAGRASQESLSRLEKAKAALVPLEREIRSLELSIAKNASHLASRQEELKAAEEKLTSESAGLPDINRLETEYFDAQEGLNQSLNNLGYTRNQVEVLETQRQQKVVRLGEKDSLNTRITDHKTLERAFSKDGIPAMLIEHALPEIQDHANEILDRLSSGEMALTFETQREFKDKKREDRRETLDILVRDGAGERPYEMFSGGEAFRVNFAIRLALSRVLAHRAGARLQTLVIDEGFGSQDADGRQRLVEAINLVSSEFAKILVITHLEELKDAFPARIEVTKSTSGSQVQVVAG